MLDDPEDMLGACLKKLGLPFSATAPASWPAPNRRPSRRSRCCAPTSMPKSATNWSPVTCWPRNSGPPPRSRPSMPRPQLAFVYPAEGFPFYCDCAVILRESRRCPPGASVPGLPAAPRRLRQDRGSHPHRHRQRVRARLFYPSRSATRRVSIRRPRSSTAASGRARSTPPPSACATASGRKSNRHKSTNDANDLSRD